MVTVQGSGLMAGSAMTYCALGGYSKATMVSSSSVQCMLSARSSGMQVVEVSLGEAGVMSRSGVQVEYSAVGRVASVSPSSGIVTGGTMVTVVGEGFMAGHTACRFGSGSGVMAEVLSSTEARCISTAYGLSLIHI